MIVNRIYDYEARRMLLAKLRTTHANATSGDYRERARRVRALADETTFPQIKSELLQVAVEYERRSCREPPDGVGSADQTDPLRATAHWPRPVLTTTICREPTTLGRPCP